MVVKREEAEAQKKQIYKTPLSWRLVFNLIRLGLIGYCLWLISQDLATELLRRLAVSP